MYKVGDSVFIVETIHRDKLKYTSKVTKVGHKYIYASGKFAYDLRFHKTPTPDGYLSGTDGYPPPELFSSQESFEAYNNLVKLRKTISTYFTGGVDLSFEQCEAIARIVGLELP